MKNCNCGGCTCFKIAPCNHCIEDHDNVDNYPVCWRCGEIFRDLTDIEILKHHINEFELI